MPNPVPLPNLFDATAGPAGYRLKALEVFNWGTFHEGSSGQDIARLVPDGHNTLLTGANGSGKTTLVDGLLALLVNPAKRFFNQSSGDESRTGRGEESYVEGHYGRTQDEEKQNSRPEKLRPDKSQTYSILLGVFANAQSLPITLVQVRWFGSGKLQHKYLVAKTELSIAEHIQFGTGNQWASRLKRQFAPGVVEDFDTFIRYEAKFKPLFGMRDKALTLFNQTVGMKVLGDLDAFIRTNMLEESTAEVEFSKLMSNYQTLLVSYRALEKARTQLTLLQPVYDLSHEYAAGKTALQRARDEQRLLEPWFAQQQVALWTGEIERQDRALDQLQHQLGQQEMAWETADTHRVELEVQIANNQVAQHIKDLERDIRDLDKSKTSKERNLKDYNRLARQLALAENPDAGLFAENAVRALAAQQALQHSKQQLKEEEYQVRKELDNQKADFEKLETELAQLENSTGKVTGRTEQIRQEILAAVGASEAEIPFLAEVMQVRAAEKAVWNNALEKLLHSFGLGLLVPERLYAAVRTYVHEADNLRGKIVFHRVDGKASRPIFPDPLAVAAKLDFNEKSPYAAWAESTVAARFNYVCTEEVTTFERAEKALLPSGLTRNKSRHERDDTAAHRHILGWDNRELLRDCQRQGRALNEAIAKTEASLRRLGTAVKQADERDTIFSFFLAAKHFSELDWQTDAHNIAWLTEQRDALENDNASFKTLKDQLRTLKEELKVLEKARDDTKKGFFTCEALLERLKTERQVQRRVVENFGVEGLAQELQRVADLTEPLRGTLSYAHFQRQKQDFERVVGQRITTLQTQAKDREEKITEAMEAFRWPGEGVTGKFADWGSDTRDLRSKIDQLGEYTERYEQIKNEQLAELETRFRDEFNRGVTTALTDYCESLEGRHQDICDTIEQINTSLRSIAFNLNPDTFIQLERTDTRKKRIHEFRFEKLRSWQPDRAQLALAADPKEAEMAHFVDYIQPFITELQAKENEKWRQEVTDVRKWSDFKAREYFRTDRVLKQVYEGSGSLSGGEGAQLAYTVLGAAIAHQFNINHGSAQTAKSFRFIVIDEAFSKLDEEKSKYLLKLCRGLGLQLMVVTPLTSLHLLEKEVDVIHWVTKAKQDPRKSVVLDIPIHSYQERKEALLAAEEANA